MTAYRERKRLAGPERGMTTGDADTDQPVTMARMTGAELLRQMRELAARSPRPPTGLPRPRPP
jgi:hypothetical protein